MGIVVAARHIQLDTKVAIKFLLPHMIENAEAVARFAREARAAVRITSEHVARVLDVGTLESGAPYMVMEFLEGSDLANWLETRGPLSVEQTTEFVLQACEAVAEAHTLGIIHRDLKPANLFCIRRADGVLSVKVLDFGISKVTGMGGGAASQMGMTQATTSMGSPYYMSPEQMASSRDVDPRADIWALGVVVYELLTRSVPFSGDTLPEVCFKIASASPPTPRNVRPEIPQPLEAVIFKCLEKDRAKRFRNVAELAVALAPFAPKRARTSVERITRTIEAAGLSSTMLAAPPSSDPGARTPSVPPLGRTTLGKDRRKVAFIGIGGTVSVLALLAAVVGVARLSRNPTPPSVELKEPASLKGTPQTSTAPVEPAAPPAGHVEPAAPTVTHDAPPEPPPSASAAAPSAPSAKTTPKSDTRAPKEAGRQAASKPTTAGPSASAKPLSSSTPPPDSDPFARLKPK
jgi:serine/threonine-protein kinase